MADISKEIMMTTFHFEYWYCELNCVLPTSYVEALISNVLLCENGAFGTYLVLFRWGYESGAVMMGVVYL